MDHLPMHPILNVPDWDAAPSACDYPRLAAILRHVKESGQMPEEHVTFDHLNEHKNHPALEEEVAKWSQIFSEKLKHAEAKTGRKIVLGLVDGFLLYWCKVSLLRSYNDDDQ
jgi:nicotinamide/nicotinate riboside kinase